MTSSWVFHILQPNIRERSPVVKRDPNVMISYFCAITRYSFFFDVEHTMEYDLIYAILCAVLRGTLCNRLRINGYTSFGVIGHTTFYLYDTVKHPEVGTKAMPPIFFSQNLQLPLNLHIPRIHPLQS